MDFKFVKTSTLLNWLIILLTCVPQPGLTQECQHEDPCSPPIPCTLGNVASYPADCEKFQKCVAPAEWVITDDECGDEKGSYSNSSCACSPLNDCLTWECPDMTTSLPPVMSAPCFTEEVEDILRCITGEIVPDRYYCTKYFECEAEAWVSKTCPEDMPYFSIEWLGIPPCTNNIARCSSIPFEDCMDITLPATTEITTAEKK